ncbi:30S ribosomal protein S19 [Candidatus Dojkabacteria bacterium]|nr:30S ribosomal protein S19 [Candidatus Dojkabacteria bacterium]
MSRSLKKGPYIDEKLLQKVQKAKKDSSTQKIKTWARESTVTPEMVGVTLSIHNGKRFIDVYITESMVGHKVGEFAPTRRFTGHSKKGKIAKATGTTGRILDEE